MTEQRRVIARVLSDAADHPDVEQVHKRATKIDPNISLATVYRTVRLFEEASILERHDFGDGRARYEEALRAGRAGGPAGCPAMALGGLGDRARAAGDGGAAGAWFAEGLALQRAIGRRQGIAQSLVGLAAILALQVSDPAAWLVHLGGPDYGVIALIFVIAANLGTTLAGVYATGVGLRQVPGLSKASWSTVALVMPGSAPQEIGGVSSVESVTMNRLLALACEQ
jgi:hypothetical protein